MKKPKDVADLASRLATAAATPLVAAPAPVQQATGDEPAAPAAERSAPAKAAKPRRRPQRSSVSVFLRISQTLYDRYDQEAVRRTKETGRGVTVQQVILDRLAEKGA